jgi:hypothetical protein
MIIPFDFLRILMCAHTVSTLFLKGTLIAVYILINIFKNEFRVNREGVIEDRKIWGFS